MDAVSVGFTGFSVPGTSSGRFAVKKTSRRFISSGGERVKKGDSLCFSF